MGAKLALNVRPEFLHFDGDGVVAHLRAPNAGGVSNGSLAPRMIRVGRDRRGDGATENFGKVELAVTRIAAGDENPAHRVPGAMSEAPVGHLVETRILAQHRGQNCGGPEVLDGAVSESGSVALGITLQALPVSRFAIFRLADPGENSVPREFDIGERTTGHNLEFLFGGKRGNLIGVLDG